MVVASYSLERLRHGASVLVDGQWVGSAMLKSCPHASFDPSLVRCSSCWLCFLLVTCAKLPISPTLSSIIMQMFKASRLCSCVTDRVTSIYISFLIPRMFYYFIFWGVFYFVSKACKKWATVSNPFGNMGPRTVGRCQIIVGGPASLGVTVAT